jgi:hypothetical protein
MEADRPLRLKETDMSTFKFALGQEAKDAITGFKGIITGRIEYISGCLQYAISPPVKEDGSKRDGEWFDEERLEIVGPGVTLASRLGGGPVPRDAPPVR